MLKNWESNICVSLKIHQSMLTMWTVPHDQNMQADALPPLVLPLGVYVKFLLFICSLHVLKKSGVFGWGRPLWCSRRQWTKMDYINWLKNVKLPKGRSEAFAYKLKASKFVLLNGYIFLKPTEDPQVNPHPYLDVQIRKRLLLYYLKCIEVCVNTCMGKNLSNKILRMDYFWPTLKNDTMEYVKKCVACKNHAHISHQQVNYVTLSSLCSLSWNEGWLLLESCP